MTQSYKKDFLLLFLIILGFFCIGLGERAYITPSEARYIEIPRQMLVTGDWLTPHINGVQYFEKPPLFYWIQAFFLQFGESEFYGRIATSIVVTLTCLATYATGRLLYGRRAGLLAAFALATSILGYGLSRVAMLDAPVTLFLTCAIASFLFAQKTTVKTGKARFYYLMYAFAALAMMTKGLIGIVIPALVIGGWIALTKNWSILLKAKLPTGLLLFLSVAAPWHILMQMQHPDFFDFYFIHEHFTRFLTNEHKRTAPWWFFIAITTVGALPWLLALFRKKISLSTDNIFLCLWIIIPLIFFSTSHSKLVPYIFPIFPPIFVLIGKALADWWLSPTAPKSLRINALFMVLMAVVGLTFMAFSSPYWAGLGCGHVYVCNFKVAFVSLFNGTQGWNASFLPLAVVTIALFVAAIIKKTPSKTLIAWHFIFIATLEITANYIAPQFDKRTIKPLVESMFEFQTEEMLPQKDDMIVAYKSYWQDLPVYLNRNITVAGWTGELAFGVEHTSNAKNWMISDEEFWVKCAEAKTKVYVFMNEGEFNNLSKRQNCPLREMGRYGKTILLQKDIK